MNNDHHDEEVNLDVETEKDTIVSTVQQEEPEKIQNDGANGGSDNHPMPVQQQLQQEKEKEDQSLH